MAGYKMDRISESILRELTAILRTVKDPRVTPYMLSVVRVDVTNDMSYATVYVSAMEGLEAAKNAVKGLVSAQGYIRRELGKSLDLRHVPELRFVADDSMEYSINIAKKLSEIERNSEKDE
jgi:ribosome-binding factor A